MRETLMISTSARDTFKLVAMESCMTSLNSGVCSVEEFETLTASVTLDLTYLTSTVSVPLAKHTATFERRPMDAPHSICPVTL